MLVCLFACLFVCLLVCLFVCLLVLFPHTTRGAQARLGKAAGGTAVGACQKHETKKHSSGEDRWDSESTQVEVWNVPTPAYVTTWA